MKHGDFSVLAKHYINRPGYSLEVLDIIATYIKKKMNAKDIVLADVGAGTGKLTENLSTLGYTGYAVEPNDEMRKEGIKALEGKKIIWSRGSAEITNLPDNSVDWVLMGSSFHWTDHKKALEEFYRILKPNGFFTAIWNPRDIEKNELHQGIECKINQIVPELKRISSGSNKNMQGMEEKVVSTEFFENVFFLEGPHIVEMTKERYLGAWMSVNDIQVQAGEKRFEKIIEMIKEEIREKEIIEVPYKSRAWTVQSTKK